MPRWPRSIPRPRCAAAADVREPGAPGGRRPLRRVAGAGEVPARARPTSAVARTHQIAHDPLPLLLGAYEEYGPIFSMRLLHSRVVFMLGPEANHFITVAHPENFHWRESSFGDLIPLLGDGLLTIDEDYHDRARAIMMPAFHREQVAAAIEAMTIEADAGDRRAAASARSSTSTSGCATWRCGSRCGRCSASIPTRPARAPPRPSIRARPRLLRHRLPPAPAARAGLALAQDGRLARGPRRDRLRRDRPPPRRARPERRDILSLLVAARGEAARASPTARSATR